MKKFKDWGLLPKVLIAIALGIICSFFFPDWLTRCFITFNSIFSNFLGLVIPILILGLIAPGIFELGTGAGRLLLVTAAIAYLSTILAGLFSYGTCSLAYPALLGDAAVSLGNIDMAANDLKPYFTIEMPPVMSVTTALVLAFIFGLTLIALQGDTLRSALRELREVIFLIIRKVIIPLLPLFIFGIFLEMGAEGNVGPVLGMFLKIIVIIFLMHVTVLVLQFCIAGGHCRQEPVQGAVDHASGLRHGPGHPVLGRHDPGDARPGHQERRRSRGGRFRGAALRHDPHVVQHSQDRGLRLRHLPEHGPGHQFRHLCGLHPDAGHHDDRGPRRAGRRHHGRPRPVGLDAGL